MSSSSNEGKQDSLVDSFLKQSVQSDSRGWLIELGTCITSWYLGEPMILLVAAIVKGMADLYCRYLNGLASEERYRHALVRNTLLTSSFLLAVPLATQDRAMQSLICFFVTAAIYLLIFELLGCTNSLEEAQTPC